MCVLLARRVLGYDTLPFLLCALVERIKPACKEEAAQGAENGGYGNRKTL